MTWEPYVYVVRQKEGRASVVNRRYPRCARRFKNRETCTGSGIYGVRTMNSEHFYCGSCLPPKWSAELEAQRKERLSAPIALKHAPSKE